MRSVSRRLRLFAGAVAVVLCVTHAVTAAAAGPGDRIETIVPEPTDTIDQYEGSLDPNNPLTGGIVDPGDEFDWWCLSVTSGVPLVVTVQGGSSSARPNCGLVQGIVAAGDEFQDLGQILGATNNGTASSATLTVTPTFTGVATVWIGNAGTNFNITYAVSMSGGTVNQSCNPCPDCPANPAVNFNEKVRFAVGRQRNVPGGIEVPLLVDCGEQVQFTQMTVEFDDTCLSFVSAVAGSGVMSPGAVTPFLQPGTTLGSALTVNASGTYGPGCRTEVFLLTFNLVNMGSPPCALVLDRRTAGANPPNHVNVNTDTDPDSDLQLVGDVNGFCDGAVEVSDLRLTKIVDVPNPAIGALVTYTVTLTNLGPSLATGITVTDLLPAGVTFVSSTPSQGTYAPGTGLWNVGSLASMGIATLTLRATVNAGTAGTTITNTASVTTADQADPNPGNNTASAPIIVQSANLGVTKTVDVPSPNVGQTVTYTITVTNAGPNTATSVRITDLLPTGVTYVSSTPSQGTYTPGTGVWDVGTIANMGSATLTLRATVNTGTGGTTITNTATVTNVVPPDPVPGNNTASAPITVQSANLGVTKTVDVPAPNVGQTVIYTITVANAGPNAATSVRVTDPLPPGDNYVSHTPSQGTYNPGTGVWDVGTIANMGSATLTLRATVNTGTGCTTITNTAAITAVDQADPVSGNNSASAAITVQCANLGVTKIVDIPSPNVGQTVTYTITVTNGGVNAATNVRITDLLPGGVTYVSNTPSQGTYVPGTGVWTVGTLANMGTATLTLRATVNTGTAGTTITNTATVTGVDQADPVSGNNSASATITVQAANLGIAKTVDIPSPNVGQTVTYTITLTNAGPNAATTVVVTDNLPPGLTYVSNTPSQGTYTPGTGVWAVGTIANLGTATLTLRATVNTGTGCTTIINTSTITGVDQADPISINNSASGPITVQCANLGVTKVVDVPSPNVGQTVTYLITVTNGGANTATNVRVTDLLPAGVTYVSNTPSQGTYASGTGFWTVGTLANMGSATLTLRATVNTGTGCTTITNTATVSGVDQADPVSGNNSANAAITVQCANLGITKAVDVPSPNVGQTVTYTITVTNAGQNAATTVRVTDLLPAGVTYVSNTPSQGTYTPGTGVWVVGTIANMGTATLTLRATVNTGTGGTTITNTATITNADQADPVTGNNSASAPITVQSADLEMMSKTVDDPTPVVGQTITYTLTLMNSGPNAATNVRVTDLLPPGLTYVSHMGGTYNPGTGVWEVGTVASPSTAVLTIRATVNAGTAGTTITNMACVTAVDQADPDLTDRCKSVALTVDCADVDILGTVRYYSNATLVLPAVPDPTSMAVTVRDCMNGTITDPADDGSYNLDYGAGPIMQACVCASRPRAGCNDAEGAVISGQDLMLVQNIIAEVGPTPTPKQRIASDLNKDGLVLSNDRLGIQQWIAHAAVCSGGSCTGQPSDNCAGTWRFVFPTGTGPGDFVTDMRCLNNLCTDQTVDIQGILIGDADGSWPNLFPTAQAEQTVSERSTVDLSLVVTRQDAELVTISLSARIDAGEALHHVIYSLDYDATAFEYLGARAGAQAEAWDLFDNPAQTGVAHGIVHRLAGMPPVTQSGEVLSFQFRARTPGAAPQFSFSRLKANDLDVEITEPAVPLPSRFALGAAPNPFNPSTRIRFEIPAVAGDVPVALHVYDIAGRHVRTLLNERRAPGVHDVEWRGVDDRGNSVGTGIYFVQIRAGTWSHVKKVALLK